jgi:transposase
MSSSVSSPPPRLISDELWALVEPLIPPRPPAVHGRTGRPRTSDRDALEGIAFVLSTGIGWTKLPPELGYGSGWTCWRRMREWAEAGVFDLLHQAVLDRLGESGRLDWSRASLDLVSVRATARTAPGLGAVRHHHRHLGPAARGPHARSDVETDRADPDLPAGPPGSCAPRSPAAGSSSGLSTRWPTCRRPPRTGWSRRATRPAPPPPAASTPPTRETCGTASAGGRQRQARRPLPRPPRPLTDRAGYPDPRRPRTAPPPGPAGVPDGAAPGAGSGVRAAGW